MERQRRDLVTQLWLDGRDFDAGQADRLNRRRNLEPESAELLNILVRTLAPPRILELGTSNGFSTIWLADALEPTGGHLTTVDNDPGRAQQATLNLLKAGVFGIVEQHVADAGVVLAVQPDGSWPVIFLDAERPAYVSYWPHLDRVLAPGGLLIVDNCISHAEQVRDFREHIDAAAGYRSTLVTVGAGLLLVSKDR